MENLNAAANYGFNLLGNLLDWARTQTGSIISRPEKINISNLLSTLVDEYNAIASSKRIRIELLQEGDEYVSYKYRGGQVLWRVDDFDLEYQDVKFISSGDIESVYIIKFPDTQLYSAWMDVEDIIVSIRTKPYYDRESVELMKRMVMLDRITMSREYFSPVYDSDQKRYSNVPDLRKTIHWEPDISLDENGEATISFYNGDRYTQIGCILEGITDQGIPVFGKSDYRIQTIREQTE